MFRVKPYIAKQALIAASLNIAQLINGYDVCWTAPVFPKLADITQTPLPRVLTSTESTWVASIMFFGIVGAYVAGFLANHIGRRSCLITGGILKILSYILLTAASNVDMLYAGRFFVGFSMGFLSLTSIIYIGEISSPNIRGIIMTTTSFFHALGGLIVYCVGPYVPYAGVGYVVISFTVVYIVTSFFIPESPMFYVIKDDKEAARNALNNLGRSEDIDKELEVLFRNAKDNALTRYVWSDLSTRNNKKALCITVPLFFFQQSSGIIAVIFFATNIFKDAGSSIEPEVATIVIGAVFFVGTLFSPLFIDRYGRRILLMVSTAGCCLAMAILGIYFYLKKINPDSIVSLGWIPLTSLVLAITAYSFGLTIIPNTMAGEMFDPKVRGLGAAISLSTGWMSGFVSTTIFSYIVNGIGIHYTFWLFAIVNVVAFIFVVTFVPETKGKSLTEISAMMSK